MVVSFKIVSGVIPGYGHDNKKGDVKSPQEIYQTLAGEVMTETGIYVSAVAVEAKTIYSVDWGCPAGGEISVVFTGTQNMEFCPNKDEYKKAVLEIAKKLKEELKQSTMTVEFFESEMTYLN